MDTRQAQKRPIFFKGIVEEIANEYRLSFLCSKKCAATILYIPLYIPTAKQKSLFDGHSVGVLGEVHPEVAQRFKIKKQRPCYFEINVDALYAQSEPLAYTIPHAIQPLKRTISFALPHGFSSQKVQDCIQSVCDSFRVVDLFPFQEDGKPWASVTFELSFENPSGDLSADSVNATLQDLISDVNTKYGSEGVYQR